MKRKEILNDYYENSCDEDGRLIYEVKDEFEKILIDIRENCFKKDYFIYPQTNRITNLIIKKYNTQPEFPWEKYDGAGIFRNKDSKKWFALIMDTDKSKIIKNKKGLVEILNIKLSKDHIKEYIEKENFYPAYHMNKIHWLTIILDDSVKDEKILELIEESYDFQKGRKNKTINYTVIASVSEAIYTPVIARNVCDEAIH